MDRSVGKRGRRYALCAVAATLALAACSGGGTSVTTPNSGAGAAAGTGPGMGTGTGGGAGSGTGSGAGSGGTGSSGTGSGSGATSSPTTAPTASAAPSGTSTAPASAPTTPPVSSLTVGPATINGALGTLAQIGILDPGYTGPIEVSVAGSQVIGTLLTTVENLQTGVLAGATGTADVLDINLAKALSLNLLGPNSTVLEICETAKTPQVCQPVTLAQNQTVEQIGSNLSSAVIVPGTLDLLQLVSEAGLYNDTDFTVTSSNNGVTVTNLGNGQYDLGAAANLGTPTTATITVTNPGGNTITIPVTVL